MTLSDNSNALNYFDQSLKIWQDLKEPIYQGVLISMIGDVYANLGNPKKAIEFFNQAMSIFLQNNMYDNLAGTYYSMAGAYIRLGDIKKALEPLQEGLKIYRDILKNPSGEADITYHIASVYVLIGETKEAIKYYNQALDIQVKINNGSAQAITMSELVSVYGKLGQRNKILYYIKEISRLKENTKITLRYKGLIDKNIANGYFMLGEYQDSIRFYTQAQEYFDRDGSKILKSQVTGLIATIYKSFLGDYQKALQYVAEAIKLQEETGFKGDQASTLNQQADIYALQGDFQKALNSYNKALEIESIITDSSSQARTLGNIARLYSLLGEYNSSLKAYHKSLSIYRKLQHIPNQAGILLNIGNLDSIFGNFDEALKAYNQALSLYRQQEDSGSEIIVLWGIAKIYRDKNDYSKALEIAHRALELSKKYNYSFQEIASNGIIGSIYLAKGDYQNALNTYSNILVNYRELGSLNKKAETLNSISIVYEFQQQHQKAIELSLK